MRLLWSVATYDDLTLSVALSGNLEPSCCLGVLDASEGLKVWIKLESRKLILWFDGNSNIILMYGISVPKTILMIVAIVGG